MEIPPVDISYWFFVLILSNTPATVPGSVNTHASLISASVSGHAKAIRRKISLKTEYWFSDDAFEMLMALISQQAEASVHPHCFRGTERVKETAFSGQHGHP